MKSDVVVVGSELDALVASLMLARRGARVRLLMPGSSSLHYAAGSIGVLGAIDGHHTGQLPFEVIGGLAETHPYKLVGEERVRVYLEAFLSDLEDGGWRYSDQNEMVLTMAGTVVPAYALPRSLARLSDLEKRRPVIVRLDGLQDFTPRLCAAGLAQRGDLAEVVSVEAPARGDSARCARRLDSDAGQWIQSLAKSIPSDAGLIILPAVLGLDRHGEIVSTVEHMTGRPVVEVPTLPPSVPGMRLMRTLVRALTAAKVDIHHDVRGLRAELYRGRCIGLSDSKSQRYLAADFISAAGGVLMGGLDVTPAGQVVDPVFGLDVVQTAPLKAKTPADVVTALHRTGITADRQLRPSAAGNPVDNIRITGCQLPAWLPNEEHSQEGVAVATAFHAAESIAAGGAVA